MDYSFDRSEWYTTHFIVIPTKRSYSPEVGYRTWLASLVLGPFLDYMRERHGAIIDDEVSLASEHAGWNGEVTSHKWVLKRKPLYLNFHSEKCDCGQVKSQTMRGIAMTPGISLSMDNNSKNGEVVEKMRFLADNLETVLEVGQGNRFLIYRSFSNYERE